MLLSKEGHIKELTNLTQISAYKQNGWVEVEKSEVPKTEAEAEVKKPTTKKKK